MSGQGPRNPNLERVSGTAGPSGSRPGSQPGSQGGSRAGSRATSPKTGKTPFPPSMGYDPARSMTKREMTAAERVGKRVDLPIEAYNLVH